jgi:predicted O-methyltransferase YrrM
MSSRRFFQYKVNDKEYDLVFIDGDHSREQVLEDTTQALNHLAPDGLVVLHDTYPTTKAQTDPQWSGTAYKARELLEDDMDLQVYTFPVTFGLTLVSRRLVLPWESK